MRVFGNYTKEAPCRAGTQRVESPDIRHDAANQTL
jgi:hypothetical protein